MSLAQKGVAGRRHRIDIVERTIKGDEAVLKTARTKHAHFLGDAEARIKARKQLQEEARHYLGFGPHHNQVKGELLLEKADVAAQFALVDRHKAIFWKGKIRKESARLSRLEQSEEHLKAELAKWTRQHGVQLVGHNKVEGGSLTKRLHVAQLVAMKNYRAGDLPGYYSQEGGPRDYRHTLYHYAYGRIWDCSTYGDGLYICCGHEAPSGPDTLTAGGYTRTQMAHGHVVSENKARIGDLVIYLSYSGDTTGHHVEIILDPDRRVTSGHGDSAVDKAGGGSTGYDLWGNGLYVIRTYH